MARTKEFVKKRLKILTAILQIVWRKKYPIYLDYPIYPSPRYGYGLPPHPRLEQIISAERLSYEKRLLDFVQYHDAFERIPFHRTSAGTSEPAWVTGWFPPLDIISLYGFIASANPKRYFEVGSGNSTTVVRRAIRDQQLNTQITSIDPQPRAEIDLICDRIIRKPVENVGLDLFEELEDGDFLLMDNSHRVFQNSDATVCFLDVLPMLAPGVTVAFHDIYLPWDYNADFGAQRYYSEQYLLAAYILAEGPKFELLLPSAYISRDKELLPNLSPIWEIPKLAGLKREGSLFWIRTKGEASTA